MKGYILNVNKVKDEDLIVTILTDKNVLNLYRFYGARHSNIQIGYKIDFEVQQNHRSKMLRGVLHLPSVWEIDREKSHYWHSFIKLLYKHLKDIDDIDGYFIDILDLACEKISLQNPKRTLIEAYLEILRNEGRIHNDFNCIICSKEISSENICLIRAFVSVCENCLQGVKIEKKAISSLFEENSTISLSDKEIDILWNVMEEGL